MLRVLSLLGFVALVVVAALVARPDPVTLAGGLLASRLGPIVTEATGGQPLWVVVRTDQPFAAVTAELRRRAARLGVSENVHIVAYAAQRVTLREHTVDVYLTAGRHRAVLTMQHGEQHERMYAVSWLAVLPPILAIVAAILLRRVVICLALGVVAGGVIATWPATHDPLFGAWHSVRAYVFADALGRQFKLEIIAFVLLISGTISVAGAAGGVRGIVDWFAVRCKTARATRLAAYFAGLLLFFDDYLNCVVIGNTMRPLADRFRVSRAKLAYIVDSTAAPVAGLSLISTWIAHEVAQIDMGLTEANLAVSPYDMFMRTVPYRFYCWSALALVFLVCWFGRDFRSMWQAERAAAEDKSDPPLSPLRQGGKEARDADMPGRAWLAVVPIAVTLISIAALMWWTARSALRGEATSGVLGTIRAVLANANSVRAFFVGSLLGYVVAVVLAMVAARVSWRRIGGSTFESLTNIKIAIVVLVLAWALGAACRDVGTATYLVAMFRESLSPVVFAMGIFLLSCLVSFSTGTSFGTMSILLPNTVALAFAVGQHSSLGGMGLATISIGAVLDGAIFGDHCSPISDTTILSAAASGCEPIEHVRTQLPYAGLAMMVAMLCGYLPVALGLPSLAAMALGVVALIVTVRLIGRRIDEQVVAPVE